VIAEVALAIAHPPYDSFCERWGATLADVLIAIGIGGEILFSMMGTRCQTEMRNRSNKKVAEAIERAAKAEEELARVTPLIYWGLFS
jgi:hypothetical protein